MLAWAYMTAGTEAARASARETALLALAGLDGECSGSGGGYRERREGSSGSRLVQYPDLRRQNPHMHLLEAFLAWHRADPSGPWLEKARAMVELLRRRFRPTGNLAEYFDDGWRLDGGEPGRIREPGHHYEWVWLLRRWYEASGDEQARADAETLYDFALRRGTDSDGLAFAAVDDAGEVLDGRKLLWPQTEMLKAQLAMFEWTGDGGTKAAAEKALGAIKTRYMRADGALFYNLLERSGAPDEAPSLSRLLYHLFVAAAEAERLLSADA
jgi:mannose/cellobiose epimerase-like protein (N-acyl-D-glucosamine 2-epimerase family)